jgi:hypothetical protein
MDNITLEDYIKEKIYLLTYKNNRSKEGLGLPLSKGEINHFSTLTSIIQVDNYAHELIMKYL